MVEGVGIPSFSVRVRVRLPRVRKKRLAHPVHETSISNLVLTVGLPLSQSDAIEPMISVGRSLLPCTRCGS